MRSGLLKITIMEETEKIEELQTRREFFKSAAKGILPILGLTLLGPVIASCDKIEDLTGCSDCAGGCEDSCSDGCKTGCKGSCSSGCQGTCNVTCYSGCKTGCESTCKGGCKTSCSTVCRGTCKGRCTHAGRY